MAKRQHQIIVILGAIVICGIAFICAGVFAYMYYITTTKVEKPVFCTMDAKLCSDGSYVGREPPNCEFKACPDLFTESYIKNATFTIEEKTFKLQNGEYKEGTKYTAGISNIVMGDLNKDGKKDAVAIINNQTGGTGSFYYLVAILNKDDKPEYVASQLLGDRIAVDSLKIENNVINLDIKDHAKGTPMAAEPDLEKSLNYELSNNKLVPVEWKTYKNDEYGFEIKYPKEYHIEANLFSTEFGLVLCPSGLTEIKEDKSLIKSLKKKRK
jgi:hypothetical protein